MNIHRHIFSLLICFLLAFSSCTKNHDPATSSITPIETVGLLNNDFAILIDVREQVEIESGMADGAMWMPSSAATEDNPRWRSFVEGLDKNKEIVLYCKSGGRAGQVAKKLSALGFKTRNMGGYSAWVSAGLPVTNPN